MKSRNEIMRNNRKRRKIENKCEICSAPRYKDSSNCLKCLKKRQEHNQKSYAKQKIMKNNGVCINGDNRPLYTSWYCKECWDKRYGKQKDNVRDRINKGLCVHCGNVATITLTDRTFCDICWFKNQAKTHTGSRKNFKEIEQILQKQEYKCVYSKIELRLGVNASLDHIIPMSRGGARDINNIQWVDINVNLMKHKLTHSEFISLIKEIYKNVK